MGFGILSKTQGYPVPGVEIEGRKLFMEILPGDSESKIQEACAFVEKAMKEWAQLTKANYKVSYDGSILKPTKIN